MVYYFCIHSYPTKDFMEAVMSSLYQSKNYENLSKFIKRRLKNNCSYAISYLLLEKFAKADKPTDWQYICLKDLKERKIISSKSYSTFNAWRDEMVKNGILICMASKRDLENNKEPIYQASKFKYGLNIKKYIEAELQLSLFERLDSKADNLRVDEISNRVHKAEENIENIISSKADNERVDILENEVKLLKQQVEGIAGVLLHALPPDTPERRKIIAENIHDKDECIKLLNENYAKEAFVKVSNKKPNSKGMN